MVVVDSGVVNGAVRKLRSSSRVPNYLLIQVAGWCLAFDLCLDLIWVPAWCNPGDAPCWMAPLEDWKLHSQRCKSIIFTSVMEGNNREEVLLREEFGKLENAIGKTHGVRCRCAVRTSGFRPSRPVDIPNSKQRAKQPKNATTSISHDRPKHREYGDEPSVSNCFVAQLVSVLALSHRF